MTGTGTPQTIPYVTDDVAEVYFPVTGSPSTSGIELSLTLAHPCVKELEARLYAPDNTTYAQVFNFNNIGPCSGSTEPTTFTFVSDSTRAAGSMNGQYTSQTNTYLPVEGFLSTFANSTSTGTWKVRLYDFLEGKTGTVTSATLKFTSDDPVAAAPSVTIDSGPDDETVDVATYTFSSTSANAAGFECLVSNQFSTRSTGPTLNGGYQSCTSPVTLDLANGEYAFRVRAVDSSGEPGESEGRRFAIERSAEPDAGGPSVTITSGPAEGSTVTGDVTFGFTTPADDFAGYECTVDGAFVASCTNPYTITGLAPGEHSFGVRGYDTDGNRGALTVRTFTIATPGPTQACTDAQTAYDTAVAQVTSLQKQIKDAKAAGQKKKVKKLKAKLSQAKADRDAAAAALEDC
ncbi:hypothetical protein GCM10022215_11660 [Nocardioides fonticola]|uniref:P/Homo B domain-containing protein n=1 Tax=Nocardioides fonticola TaxID=450363 RepID=A0ABP7XER4_9ACTN